MPIARRRPTAAARRRECRGGVDALRDRHPAVLVGAREDARSITLERLIVPSESLGRGFGSAFMRDLLAYADRHRKQVRLTPSGAFGGAPRRLVAFYARFGFVANEGTQRDPACRERMYRNPGRSRSPRTPSSGARALDGQERSLAACSPTAALGAEDQQVRVD